MESNLLDNSLNSIRCLNITELIHEDDVGFVQCIYDVLTWADSFPQFLHLTRSAHLSRRFKRSDRMEPEIPGPAELKNIYSQNQY